MFLTSYSEISGFTSFPNCRKIRGTNNKMLNVGLKNLTRLITTIIKDIFAYRDVYGSEISVLIRGLFLLYLKIVNVLFIRCGYSPVKGIYNHILLNIVCLNKCRYNA